MDKRVTALATKPGEGVPGTNRVEGETIPTGCPLTSTYNEQTNVENQTYLYVWWLTFVIPEFGRRWKTTEIQSSRSYSGL